MQVLHTPELKDARDENRLTVGVAQIAPVWLDRAATSAKVKASIEQAAAQACKLVTFGEALVPGVSVLD